MLHRIILGLASAAAVLLVCAATTLAQDTSGWQEYSYPQLGFAVRAPKEARFLNGYFEFAGTRLGADHLRLYVMDVAPGDTRSESQILEDRYQAFVPKVHHVVALNPTTEVRNHPIRAFDFVGTWTVRAFWCVANGHIYAIEAWVHGSHPFPVGTDELISSFRILETGAAQNPSGPARPLTSQKAVIYGTVYDQAGAPISGVQVTLENTALGLHRSLMTASDGSYSFSEVPPGSGYKLTASKDGKVIDVRTDITAQVGEEHVVLPALKAGARQTLPTPKPASQPRPLSADDVVAARAHGLPNQRLASLVRQYGVDFRLTTEIESRLRSAGADDSLIEAIRDANRAAPPPASPQQNSVLFGTVYDADARGLAGAKVTLENPAIGYSRATMTAPDGTYSFAEVPPASGYKVTASKDGKTIDIRSNITVQVGEESVVFPALKAQAASPPAPAPEPGSILVTSNPPGAQVYLDNAFRGKTAQSDGQLIVPDVPPGRHALRLSADGRQDWKDDEVVIIPGARRSVQATLERTGPKPLKYSDIEEALGGGIANAHVAAMVKEYGVDFALSDQQESQLRKLGADDKLIIAIMKNKK